MICHVVVAFHSATGAIRQLAVAVAEGADDAGAEVRLRQITDDAADRAVGGTGPATTRPATTGPAATWPAATRPAATGPAGTRPKETRPASLDDLLWGDAVVFGTPTHFGNVSAPVLRFLASAADLAASGLLADTVVSGFTTATSPNGGQEASLLALYRTLQHWAAIIAPTGYTDPALRAVGGNPYGLSITRRHRGPVDEVSLAAARALGRRVATVTSRLAAPRAGTPQNPFRSQRRSPALSSPHR